MSKPTVVDTNVILAANRQHGDVSEECIIDCIQRLQALMNSGIVVIDDAYRILAEYQNRTNRKGQKEVGDIFVRWLLRNSANAAFVHCVGLTELPDDHFEEFPDQELALVFDPPDRKFVAVAHGCKHLHATPLKPKILQAADSKWIDWWQALESCSIEVEFLCRDDVCRFYRKKFPQKPEPKLP